jgi:hypothetical protein
MDCFLVYSWSSLPLLFPTLKQQSSTCFLAIISSKFISRSDEMEGRKRIKLSSASWPSTCLPASLEIANQKYPRFVGYASTLDHLILSQNPVSRRICSILRLRWRHVKRLISTLTRVEKVLLKLCSHMHSLHNNQILAQHHPPRPQVRTRHFPASLAAA